MAILDILAARKIKRGKVIVADYERLLVGTAAQTSYRRVSDEERELSTMTPAGLEPTRHEQAMMRQRPGIYLGHLILTSATIWKLGPAVTKQGPPRQFGHLIFKSATILKYPCSQSQAGECWRAVPKFSPEDSINHSVVSLHVK
ncbi:hypothetical protein AUP68_13886 [Ilyonectria robusta]